MPFDYKSHHRNLNSETELYDILRKHVIPVGQLERYSYPIRDPDHPGRSLASLMANSRDRHVPMASFALSYSCGRCKKIYQAGSDGKQLAGFGECTYHPESMRTNWRREFYQCCKGGKYSNGCARNSYHVHRGENLLKRYEGFVETQSKPERDPNKHGIFALDCEMCYTPYGLELTQVTVINYEYEVVYESLVKPDNEILDYNTYFTGLREEDLVNITTRLADVQRDLLEMFSSGTLLVGHSLDSDMKCLKILHKNFIDSAQLFPHSKGLPIKNGLKHLVNRELNERIQVNQRHDSKEDASAALCLVMKKCL